jgi:hypothetical protein
MAGGLIAPRSPRKRWNGLISEKDYCFPWGKLPFQLFSGSVLPVTPGNQQFPQFFRGEILPPARTVFALASGSARSGRSENLPNSGRFRQDDPPAGRVILSPVPSGHLPPRNQPRTRTLSPEIWTLDYVICPLYSLPFWRLFAPRMNIYRFTAIIFLTFKSHGRLNNQRLF